MPYKRDVIQYFFYFATFSMKKKKNLKFKTVKAEGFHPRSRLRSAATPQHPSKLKNKISLFLVLLLYHAFSYYDTQNSIVIASVRRQSRKNLLFPFFLFFARLQLQQIKFTSVKIL
jgi:hypothetical protein